MLLESDGLVAAGGGAPPAPPVPPALPLPVRGDEPAAGLQLTAAAASPSEPGAGRLVLGPVQQTPTHLPCRIGYETPPAEKRPHLAKKRPCNFVLSLLWQGLSQQGGGTGDAGLLLETVVDIGDGKEGRRPMELGSEREWEREGERYSEGESGRERERERERVRDRERERERQTDRETERKTE